MPNDQDIKIGKAKGRPMLTWVGKKPLTQVRAYPAQKVESFKATEHVPDSATDWNDWPEQFDQGGLLFHGDNKDVLAHLLANGFRGKIKLIYIDPPFDSGADYVRSVKLRGLKGSQKIDGEDYALGEQIQYTDIWANDNYLQFIFERLLLLKELLSPDGTMLIHCDSSKNHHLRCLLDEVFGCESFINEIVWSYRRWPSNSRAFQSMHDTIFWYAKDPKSKYAFNKQYEEASESYMKRFGGKTQVLDTESGSRKITSDDDTKGMPLRDVWDISIIAGFKSERTNYPTQKPEELLERVIKVCSDNSDIVLDCFIGSGTTAAAAQKLGRRWIGSDINKGAIQTTTKRLQKILSEQAEALTKPQQNTLVGDEEEPSPSPCQLSFSTWRVNDYDLQIQHNEALDLACEYIGITRTRTDSFFDGTRGKRLVKVIPFNHPLTPLDLESIKEELARRPEEDRDIEVVALGMEVSARAWLENYNRNRPLNKLHLIELRTDAKYGGFIKHEPLEASVMIERTGDSLTVEVTDVFSPTIVKRLNLEQGLFRAQIDDWRAVVDCILIDSAYDGEVFTIALSDVPEKKSDLVQGQYTLPAPAKDSTVAVKIIDMLGEELIVSQTV